MAIRRILGKLYISQLFLFMIFIISGAIINTLQLFTLPLWILNKTWFRKINCYLTYLHWAQLIFVFDVWSGSEVVLHCDEKLMDVVGHEPCLLVLNHRYDLDWLWIWSIADKMNIMHASKCFMKNDIKYIPFVGWSLMMLEMPFLKRDYAKDKKTVLEGLRMLTEYPFPSVLLLFCEGTRFTKEKNEKANEIAKAKGLPPLKHHVLPRTKGFSLAVEAFKGKVNYIVNGVCSVKNDCSVFDLLLGKKVSFHVYVKLLPLSEVPSDTWDDSGNYCHKMYQNMDEAYEYFVQHKTYEGYDDTKKKIIVPKNNRSIYIMTMWLLLIGVPLTRYMWGLFASGSILTIMSAFGVFVLLMMLCQYMVDVTETSKGSQYGTDLKKSSSSATLNGAVVESNKDHSKNE